MYCTHELFKISAGYRHFRSDESLYPSLVRVDLLGRQYAATPSNAFAKRTVGRVKLEFLYDTHHEEFVNSVQKPARFGMWGKDVVQP